MKYLVQLTLSPEIVHTPELLYKAVAAQLKVAYDDIRGVRIMKKSLDARRKIAYQIQAEVYVGEAVKKELVYQPYYKEVSSCPPVLIIGSGPAGLFAALRALEVGLKPIILEQGKNVKERKHDIATITRQREVNEHSNWCFGEGGAGTYSDGKLYTRSTKRGNIQAVLAAFVAHGANENICIDTHAHIGTDKLSGVISSIRQTIEQYGGEYFFNTKVVDLIVNQNTVEGVVDSGGNQFKGVAVVLATGHSARDLYQLFYTKGWKLEVKPFAAGVRIEHPQDLINEIQYHSKQYSSFLPPASYSLVTQVKGSGVFSFCMCPGGLIVPASTAKNELVLNGMSNSKRNSPYANAGIAVTISPELVKGSNENPLALLQMQQALEKTLFEAGGSNLNAPTQRLTDFCSNKSSASLNSSSYLLGCTPAPLHTILPPYIKDPLQEAFRIFGKKMKGYYTELANIHAIESRTSSPVRIPRGESLEHVQLKKLYPCGEGAGYAGGIVSSALDGINCINQIALTKGLLN